jgi:oligoribonuclease (3'-5' exoribonuclease)
MTRKDAGNAHTDVADTVTKRGHGEHEVGERLKRVAVQAHLAQVISIQCIRTHIRSQVMQCVCVNSACSDQTNREREREKYIPTRITS